MTAVSHVDAGRIDHEGYVPEMWVGLLATSLYMVQVGPIIPNLSDYIEAWVTLGMFVGSVICLIGVVLGTKWFFPKVRRRVSYIIELVGLPIIILSLGALTYASVDSSQLVLTALGGGLGLCLEIGSVRMIVDLVDQLGEED